MLENQNIKERLRNYLNVQLTESNVVELDQQMISTSRIENNEIQSNSDMSIIHQLGLLQNSRSIIVQNDFIEYKYKKNQKAQIYGQRMNYYQNQNSPLSQKNKIKKYKQQLNLINEYQNLHKASQKQTFKSNIFKNPKSQIKQETYNYNNLLKGKNQMADIQEKISILPFQLQQKIKENLQKKIKFVTNEERQISPIKNDQILTQNYDRSPKKNLLEQNLNVKFILPSQQNNTRNLHLNRQKFVSLNRLNSSQNKSITKSIILNEGLELKSKYSTPHLQLNTDRKYETSQQKNLLRSMNLKYEITNQLRQNNILDIARSKSKQKYIEIQKSNTKKDLYKHSSKDSKRQQRKSFKDKFVQKRFDQKQILLLVSQQFNKSKIIKHYNEILNSIPKCKKCSTSYGALTIENKKVVFVCNQCELKIGRQRSVSYQSPFVDQIQCTKFSFDKKSVNLNHPIIGALFDVENKLINQSQMKIFNFLLKQISLQLEKIEEKKRKFIKLQEEIQNLKNKLKKNSRIIFDTKNKLKKMFSQEFDFNFKEDYDQKKVISFQQIIPSEYLQELDLWYKIKSQNFQKWPQINQKIQILCPLYMKKNINTIKQFLDPLFHNFQNNQIKISVSQALKLPVKALGCATFLVDGSYNISNFDKIQKLNIQFINKRTFREITSIMQNLPTIIDELTLNYNHKLNSHISAQKYPILTKIASIRSCKKLNVVIQNCKDEDDLINSFKVMTKKRQLRITTTRSIYIRKPALSATNQLRQLLKRIGKNIILMDLNLSIKFEQKEIYRQLMTAQRTKLTNFSLKSTLTPEQDQKGNIILFENEKQVCNREKKAHTMQNCIKQNKQESDNLMSIQHILDQQNYKQLNNKNIIFQKLNKNENLTAKMHFQQKIRKKWQTIALLRQNLIERQQLEKLAKQEYFQDINHYDLKNKQQKKHLLRLQILKMLL